MGSDEDEFYDSIEDTEFGKFANFCHDKHISEDSTLNEFDSKKLRELYSPFYNRNMEKTEIDSLKNHSKGRTVTTIKKTKGNRRMPILALANHKKNRSYLSMFYAKNGQFSKLEPIDSNRATCPELRPRNNLYSRSHSKVMKKESSEKGIELLTGSDVPFNSCIISSKRSKRDTSKSKLKSKPANLGNLRGPNIAPEKLELLRKGLRYGNTASERNKIKLSENKLVH